MLGSDLSMPQAKRRLQSHRKCIHTSRSSILQHAKVLKAGQRDGTCSCSCTMRAVCLLVPHQHASKASARCFKASAIRHHPCQVLSACPRENPNRAGTAVMQDLLVCKGTSTHAAVREILTQLNGVAVPQLPHCNSVRACVFWVHQPSDAESTDPPPPHTKPSNSHNASVLCAVHSRSRTHKAHPAHSGQPGYSQSTITQTSGISAAGPGNDRNKARQASSYSRSFLGNSQTKIN